MLHTKIIDTEKAKIEISNAEKFIASSKFGASIFFTGTVRDFNDDGEILVEKRYIYGLKVCNEGGNISVGDLICTSSTPGYFMKQADDIVHNYTAGKCMQHIIFDSTGKKENIYCIMMCG